ncbi:MAG: hypothetical protein IJO29_09040 [Oscillospiraceae bacterium]|nr:hypothetical protein [Oscillospiraceae bacterium]
MAFYLVNSLKNEDVHGTDNTKKTACGIKYSTPDAAKLFALGKEMHDIKELTCDRCKEVLAMKMIKESNKQMAQERKEERKKSKQAAKSVDYIPAPETKTNYTAPRPVAKNQPEKAAKNDKPKEDFKVNGEFIPKSLRKYGNDNPFGTKNEEVTAKDEEAAAEVVQEENAQEVVTETVVETPAVQQSAISGIAPINIPGIDIVAPQPTGFVSEVANEEPKPTPTVAPINIPGIDIVAPQPTGFVSEVTNEVPKPTPTVAPINIPGIDIIEPPTAPIIEPEPVKEEKKPVDMIDFSDFEDLRPKKKESKPLDFDDLDDFIIGTPMSRKPAAAVSVEEFKVPEIPSVPVVNTAPAMPEIPSVPVVNTAPVMPEIPSVPVVNTAPAMPEIPSVPVVNTAPVMPEIPSVPVVNTAPVMPEIPSVSVVNPTPVVAKKPVVAPLDKSVSAPPLSEASTMSDVERPVITSMDTAPSRPNIRMTTNAIDDDIIAVPSFASSRPAVADSVEDAAPVPVITSLEDVEKALNKMQGIETIDEPVEEEPEVVVPAFKEYKPMSKTEIEKRKLERVQKSEPDRPLSRAEQKRLEKEEKKKAKIDAEFAKDMAKRGITSDSMRDRRRR